MEGYISDWQLLAFFVFGIGSLLVPSDPDFGPGFIPSFKLLFCTIATLLALVKGPIGGGLIKLEAWSREGAIATGALLTFIFLFVFPSLAVFKIATAITVVIYHQSFPKYGSARPSAHTETDTDSGTETGPES